MDIERCVQQLDLKAISPALRLLRFRRSRAMLSKPSRSGFKRCTPLAFMFIRLCRMTFQSLEVRLHRALQEASKQKEAARQTREDSKDLGQGQRWEVSKLEGQCQRLERQKASDGHTCGIHITWGD